MHFAAPTSKAVPIHFVTKENWEAVKAALPATARAFAFSCRFEAKPGRCLALPDAEGGVAAALFGLEGAEAPRDPLLPGKLVGALPAGVYRFANAPHDASLAALAFLLASYRFTRYREAKGPLPELIAPESVDAGRLERIAAAVAFGRDLVNTPANDLGPEALERAATKLAKKFGAKVRVIRGDDLLKRNFPLIHAVGRAAGEPPRLIDFSHGRVDAPKVTLVGKGVTFDTGGLDIKPASGMELMKKDMGGAAVALALARMIMASSLDLRLRVLIPIVENSISATAFRPGDILRSRKGLTVEIGNTDAEGRLILADALALADEEAATLMFDFATLTGAARVALGPDLPPFYTDDEALAADIARVSAQTGDPVWRLPLWRPYDSMLDGKISDLNNSPSSPFAGSITAALFLKRFVAKSTAWAHFDVYAWNPKARASGPEGGEIQAARALFALLEERFGASSGADGRAGKAKRR
ncbi:MAG TPA: leucyl aminopeptidase family protein [Roseiarcus sp.]|nr:leucyl aminopeptidase family protein [Roseiarcus sp.]